MTQNALAKEFQLLEKENDGDDDEFEGDSANSNRTVILIIS